MIVRCVVLLLVPLLAAAQVSVPTAQYDLTRANANANEVLLRASNVSSATFGKLFTRSVDASIYAWPLYLPGLSIPGRGVRNVLLAATMANTVYAFDADDPAESLPLWQRTLAAPPPGNAWTGPVTWGILSTPVADLATNTVYAVAQVGSAANNSLWIYALDLSTGADKFGSPSQIQLPGPNGMGPSTPYTIQRTGLALANGSLYIGIANFLPDANPLSQEGFVLRYSAANVQSQLARFRATPTGLKGGIWQAGRGLAIDGQGFVYAATAGGSYNGVDNFGSSIVKLNGNTLEVADWFTPANHAQLYQNNLDPSGGGVILIPGANLLVAGGKEGVVYLLNRANMGQLQGTGPGAVQQFAATSGCGQTDCAQTLAAAFWNRSGSPLLYLWDRGDVLRAFSFNGSTFQTAPQAVGTVSSAMAGNMTVSSRGSVPGSGVVWAITAAQNANETLVPATLRAFDAANVATQLYSSDEVASRDAPGMLTKFAPPVVANGKVYVVTHSNQVAVYGPLCGVDVTSDVTVARGGLRFVASRNRYVQTVTVTNQAPAALSGPIHLALDSLSPQATLTSSTAATTCAAPAGSPLATVVPAGGWLAPGASRTVTLEFAVTGSQTFQYTARVLAGGGSR